jgi:uridylate kinase
MRRVLLKMSGEAVADDSEGEIFSLTRLGAFARQVAAARSQEPDLEIGIVVGGGNILRGASLTGVDRTRADHMGMLATVINALALENALRRAGLEPRVMSGISIPQVAEPYIYGRALKHLRNGRVVVFAGGTGNPYFTTDSAAALRAAEIGASALLLAKFGTDAVYDRDPRTNPDAKFLGDLTFDELLSLNLQVMDAAAVAICRDARLPIYVFEMDESASVTRALLGAHQGGTWVGKAVEDPGGARPIA